MHDLRFAWRTLRRNLLSTILIVAMLAIGIGASTTLFSLFDALLLRPLPVSHPEQLVRLVQQLPKFPPRSYFPYPYYEALRDHAASLRFVFGETGEDRHFRMTEPGPATQVTVQTVTPEYFSALAVPAYLGRTLLRDDAIPMSDTPAAVLSYGFWRRRFGGDRSIVSGRTLTINGRRLMIVGVMPRAFNGLSADTTPDLRIPLSAYPLLTGDKVETASFALAGRLKTGTSLPSSQTECLALWHSTMSDYYRRVENEPPVAIAALLQRGMNLEPLSHGTSVLRDRLEDVLRLLMAAILILVLIIGLNVAGLLLVRSAARQQEFTVRLAIGASAFRLAKLMAVESVLLSIFAATAALLVNFILTPIALRLLPPVRNVYTSVVPVSIDTGMNWRVSLFLLLTTIVATLLFTIASVLPTLQLSLDAVLRSVRATITLHGRRLLISVQIALCTFLLITAGELVRSFHNLADTASGFAQDSVATFTCDLEGYKGSPIFLQTLIEKVQELPGVVSVATSSVGVMRGHGRSASVALAGKRVGRAEFMAANANDISPDYFRTLGMSILAGRDLTSDDKATHRPSGSTKAIVNTSFVRRFLSASANPLGQRFGTAVEGMVAKPDFEIVGVVSDAKYRSLREPTRPTFYTLESDFDSFVLNVRSRIPPEAIIAPIRRTAASLAPDLPFLEVNTLAREIAETTAPERATATVASLFGILAALLAGIGTYGLLAYTVRQRRREIGIRVALGAGPSQVGGLLARQSIAMTVSGIVAGAAASFAVAPALRSLLYGMSPIDPLSFAGAGLFVGFVAAVATILPVLSALRIEPADTLRTE